MSPVDPRRDSDDPWERLEAARARKAVRSPIKAPEGGWQGPEPVLEPNQEGDEETLSPASPGRDATAKAPPPAKNRARKATPKKNRPRKQRPNAFTQNERAELHRLAAQPGATAASIARTLDIKADRVRHWARTEGVTLADGRQAAKGRPPTWDIDLACNLARDGHTTQAIAARVEVSVSTVRRALVRRGEPVVDGRSENSGRNNPVTRRLDALETAHLAKAYERLGSVKDVAKELQLPSTTTSRLLRARGIDVRASGEVQEGRPGEDRAGPLRDLMAANGVTSSDVRAWALAEGREVHPQGVPSRELIEAYLLAFPRRQVA